MNHEPAMRMQDLTPPKAATASSTVRLLCAPIGAHPPSARPRGRPWALPRLTR